MASSGITGCRARITATATPAEQTTIQSPIAKTVEASPSLAAYPSPVTREVTSAYPGPLTTDGPVLDTASAPYPGPASTEALPLYPGPGSPIPTPQSQSTSLAYPPPLATGSTPSMTSSNDVGTATVTGIPSAGTQTPLTGTAATQATATRPPTITRTPFPTSTPTLLPSPTPIVPPTPTATWPAEQRTEIIPTDPKTVELASGRVQLVEFYATWCGTCRAIAPAIHRLEDRYGDQMNFIYLDVSDINTRQLQRELGYTRPPHFFLLDEDGGILKEWQGDVSEVELTAYIEYALLP